MIAPESKLHRLLRRQSIAFLAVAIIASIALMLVGFLVEPTHPILSKILITVSSSGIGTCFGLVIGSVTGSSAVSRIKELIEATLDNSICSDENSLAPFRKVWHHYLVTKIDGKFIWRYRILDFERSSPPGKLVSTIVVQGTDGENHGYVIEGYVVNPRLVMIQRPTSGSEMPVVHLYPFASDRFRGIIAGTAYLQSWDGANFQSIALMSATPIELDILKPSEGTLPEESYSKLFALWNQEAKKLNIPPFSNDETV